MANDDHESWCAVEKRPRWRKLAQGAGEVVVEMLSAKNAGIRWWAGGVVLSEGGNPPSAHDLVAGGLRELERYLMLRGLAAKGGWALRPRAVREEPGGGGGAPREERGHGESPMAESESTPSPNPSTVRGVERRGDGSWSHSRSCKRRSNPILRKSTQALTASNSAMIALLIDAAVSSKLARDSVCGRRISESWRIWLSENKAMFPMEAGGDAAVQQQRANRARRGGEGV